MGIEMAVSERINLYVAQLPEQFQIEVLGYVEYLLDKARKDDAALELKSWASFSLDNAMKGLEEVDGIEYTEDDIKREDLS